MRWLLVLAVACGSSTKHRSEVHADRRVELVAIVARLAGTPPYTRAASTGYVGDVDRAFAAFRDDPAVTATRALLAEHGISYDAPMDLAVHLDDHLALREPPGDRRWQGVDLDGYLAQLRAFAEHSGFEAFFTGHRAAYAALETRLATLVDREDPGSWFEAFFGARAGARYVVVPCPLAGPYNFGVHNATEMYQVLGGGDPDDLEVELIVHEMAHSYINPIFAAHRAELEAPGQALFARVADVMRKQAYTTWDVMMNEAGVRAVTVLYLRERHGAERAAAAIREQERLGFTWTGELVEQLARYQADRARYRDFGAFVPELAAWFAAR